MSPPIVARAVVAIVGGLVLVAGAVPAASAFRSALASDAPDAVDTSEAGGKRQLDRIHHAQFECIRAAVDDQLPPGVPVAIPLDPTAPEPDLWHQRLIELAFPRAPIVAEPGPGITTMTVAIDDTGAGCTGVRLVVVPGA